MNKLSPAAMPTRPCQLIYIFGVYFVCLPFIVASFSLGFALPHAFTLPLLHLVVTWTVNYLK